jgi:hypothetical protein
MRALRQKLAITGVTCRTRFGHLPGSGVVGIMIAPDAVPLAVSIKMRPVTGSIIGCVWEHQRNSRVFLSCLFSPERYSSSLTCSIQSTTFPSSFS